MGGCSDCNNKGGCDTRKGSQRELLAEAVARVYPDRIWGRPDDEAGFGAGIGADEGRRIARSIASLVQAPVYFRRGAEEDLCDFAWILCVGRPPSLLEVREGRAKVESGRIEEKYLRLALSKVARMGAAQEVTLELDGLDEAPPPTDRYGREVDEALLSPSQAMVREAPRPGVFDPILLKRMQKVVAFLEAQEIAHIDFGLLDKPLVDGLPGAYSERFGVEPRLANYLFFAQPVQTQTVTLVG